MLRIQEGRNDHVETHGFTLLGCTGHQQVRRVRQVKDLDLLGNRVTDGHGQLRLALPISRIVEQFLERNHGGDVVGDLDAYRIGERYDADAPGIHRDGDIFLQAPDGGNLHTGGREHLVEGHRRADDGLDVVDLDLVIIQCFADLVVIPLNLFAGDLLAAARVVLQKAQRRELVARQLVPDIDPRKLRRDLRIERIVGNDLDIGILRRGGGSGGHHRLCNRLYDRLYRCDDFRLFGLIVIHDDIFIGQLRIIALVHFLRSLFRAVHIDFGVVLLFSERHHPIREAAAHQEQPDAPQDKNQDSGRNDADQVGEPFHGSHADTAAQAPAEENPVQTGQRTDIREQQRQQPGTRKYAHEPAEGGTEPLLDNQGPGQGTNISDENEGSEPETSSDDEMGRGETDFTAGIVDIDLLLHHLGIADQASVRLPVEDIRHGGDQQQGCDTGDDKTGDKCHPVFLLLVHLRPPGEKFGTAGLLLFHQFFFLPL